MKQAQRNVISYSIHNILKFKIVKDKRSSFLRDLNFPFSFFEVEEVKDPEITVNIGKFSPSNNNCYLVDHKYYIKQNYFYCKDSEGRAKWEVEVLGFEEGDTTINFNGRLLSPQQIITPDLLPQNLLLKPLIGYKLGRKGYFFVHAAAVSRDGQAYLLAGRGGAFKTTLAMDFVRKRGFHFLGDDGIIIHENKVLSLPMHLGLFEYRLQHLVTEDLSYWDKVRLLKYLRKNPVCKDTDVVSVVDSATLKAVFFLVKTNGQKMDVSRIDLREAIAKLIEANKLEMTTSPCPMVMPAGSGRYLKYMMAYSFIFPNSQVARYWSDLEKGVEHVLAGLPFYEINIPQYYSSTVFDEVQKCTEQAP